MIAVVQFLFMVGFFMSLYAAPVGLLMALSGWTAPADHPIILVLVLLALSVGTVLRLVAKEME